MGLESDFFISEQHAQGVRPPTVKIPLDHMVEALRAPVDNDPSTLRRVHRGLITLDAKKVEKVKVNAGPLDEAVMPSSATEGRAFLERVLRGLRNLGIRPSVAAPPATEAATSEASPPSPPELPASNEQPSPAETTMVVPTKRPVRPSKIVGAVTGFTPLDMFVNPAEATTVTSDQQPLALPNIPPLDTPPAEATLVLGGTASTLATEMEHALEPLPQLTDGAVGQSSGVWALPEHLGVGYSVVTSPIENLPSDSIPGPTDFRSILDGRSHLDLQS